MFGFLSATGTRARGSSVWCQIVKQMLLFWLFIFGGVLTAWSLVMFRLLGKPHQPFTETEIMRWIFLCLSVGNCLSVLEAGFFFFFFSPRTFSLFRNKILV